MKWLVEKLMNRVTDKVTVDLPQSKVWLVIGLFSFLMFFLSVDEPDADADADAPLADLTDDELAAELDRRTKAA